jgi:hypothetical protein
MGIESYASRPVRPLHRAVEKKKIISTKSVFFLCKVKAVDVKQWSNSSLISGDII